MGRPNGAPERPAERDPRRDRKLAGALAATGGTAAVATLLAFYVPGMVESGKDFDDMLFVLALPAVALAVPFALLSFIRVRAVLLVAVAVLAFTLASAAWDLFTGPPDGRGESLIVFGIVIVVNFVDAVIALIVSASYNAARRRG